MKHGAAVAALLLGLSFAAAAAPRGAPGSTVPPDRIRPLWKEPPLRPRAWVVLVPGLEYGDLLGWHGAALRGGALGLLSLGPGAGAQPWSAYATLAAGAPVAAGPEAGWAFEAEEPVPGRRGARAASVYRALTGQEPGPSRILHLGWAALAREGKPAPGYLASALRERGRRTAAWGNADDAAPLRAGVLLAADRWGRVDGGRLKILRPAPELPAGVETDWEALVEEASRLPEDVALAVVEAGDLARLEADRSRLGEERYRELRQRVQERTARGIGELLQRAAAPGDLVAVLALGSRGPGLGGIWIGVGGEETGPRLLASPTTRRAGLVALVDVMPTLAAWFGLPVPPQAVGRPVGAVEAEAGAPEGLARLQEEIRAVHGLRAPLIRGYALGALILLGATAAALAWGRTGLLRSLRPFWLASLLVPPAFLVLPAASGKWACLAWAAMLGAAAHALSRLQPLWSYGAASGMAVLALLADTAAGGLRVVRSPLGYSWVAGARFYGVGNEYEGVVLGAGAVAAGCAAALAGRGWRRAAWIPVAALAGLAWVLGSPGWGADFGGALAAGAAAGAALGMGCGWRREWVLLAALGGAALAAGMAVAADAGSGGLSTHMAQAVVRAQALGWGELADLALRKVELNLRLIRYTVWSRVLLALLGMLAYLVYRPPGAARRAAQRHPALHAALAGAVAGALTALVVNDSGVVAAATALVYAVPVAAEAAAMEASPPLQRVDSRGGGFYNESGFGGSAGSPPAPVYTGLVGERLCEMAEDPRPGSRGGRCR